MHTKAVLFSLLPVAALASPFHGPQHCVRAGYIYDHIAACHSAIPFCESYLTTTVKPTRIMTRTTVTTIPTTKTVETTSTDTSTATVYTDTTTITASTTTVTVTTCQPSSVFDGNVYEEDAYGNGYIDSITYSSLPTFMPRDAMAMTEAPAAMPTGAGHPKQSCGVQKQFSSVEVSSACSCYLRGTITTTVTKTKHSAITTVTTAYPSIVETTTTTMAESTTTTTPTATATVGSSSACVLPDTSCGNSGLAWAYYQVPKNQLNTPFDPERPYTHNPFYPALYKTLKPQYSGVTPEVGGWKSSGSNEAWDIYGHALSEDYFVLDHVTYFYPPVDGDYTVSFPYSDNLVYLWLGNPAYSGWTAANALLSVDYQGLPSRTATLTSLGAGQFYALRIMYGAGKLTNDFQMSITAPGGEVLLASNQADAQYFVTQSCDGTTAPPFPPFGSET